jgi:enoyl-CoA hydratase/carnithine racemase
MAGLSFETEPDELVEEFRDNVLVLRLNRPKVRNALSWTLIEKLGATLAASEANPDVSVVVITGSGDRAFCSGEDLRSLAAGESAPPVHEAFMRLLSGRLSIPVIAAVNGTAVAAGLEILLGCDVVVASSAARFGLPEVKRGLIAGTGCCTSHVASRSA